jgi:hypothetical protein
MIKLFSLKKDGQKADGRSGAVRQSAAHLRISKGECNDEADDLQSVLNPGHRHSGAATAENVRHGHS